MVVYTASLTVASLTDENTGEQKIKKKKKSSDAGCTAYHIKAVGKKRFTNLKQYNKTTYIFYFISSFSYTTVPLSTKWYFSSMVLIRYYIQVVISFFLQVS